MRAASLALFLLELVTVQAHAQALRGFEPAFGTDPRSGATAREEGGVTFGGGPAFGADMTRRSLGGGAGGVGGGPIGQPPQPGLSGSGDLTVSGP